MNRYVRATLWYGLLWGVLLFWYGAYRLLGVLR